MSTEVALEPEHEFHTAHRSVSERAEAVRS